VLSTRERTLVLDTLRPPQGFELDYALGTSYSLDLLALLAAPLAFTLFEWQEEERENEIDPLSLLDAVRRHARRVHLFCQAGQIRVPEPGRTLLAYLERCVVEAVAPSPGASFHPKVWVLRYRDSGSEEVRYRVICATRNLTFDRCWDTAVVLDGELTSRRKAFAANHPLADFVAALPGMAVRGRTRELEERAATMAEELRRVRFEPPEGVEEVYFHPLGLPMARAPSFPPEGGGPRRKLLVISPFLTDSVVRELATENWLATLVSTPEALDEMSAGALNGVDEVLVLRPEADVEARDVTESAEQAAARALRGLHVKLYAMDDRWTSRVWTGSANATADGLLRNVELMVELVGRRKDLGIDALLGRTEGGANEEAVRDGFYSLLQPYQRMDKVEDREVDALQDLVRKARAEMARAHLSFVATALDGGEYGLDLVAVLPFTIPRGVRVQAWPASLKDHSAREVTARAGVLGRWDPVSFEALTAFCNVEVTAGEGELAVCERFALALSLEGAPDDRQERLLLSLLRDPKQVLRLLMLLLAEEGMVPAFGDGDGAAFAPFGPIGAVGEAGEGLLEALLVALERSPYRLDEVARLLEDLSHSADGKALLPAGLPEIWTAIWAVRQEEQV
jgi:hypothetical protein